MLGDVQMVGNLDGLRKVCFQQVDVLAASELGNFIRDCDAIVSAAPYHLNKTVARAFARSGRSYFDLTEDVDTANFVRDLAEGSRATFMPQCGLAPGAINIIGSGLAHSFKVVRSLEMRVGALPLSCPPQKNRIPRFWPKPEGICGMIVTSCLLAASSFS
jgi:saccharopine dehydrogenase-like NADP-dependent oxidoreductase